MFSSSHKLYESTALLKAMVKPLSFKLRGDAAGALCVAEGRAGQREAAVTPDVHRGPQGPASAASLLGVPGWSGGDVSQHWLLSLSQLDLLLAMSYHHFVALSKTTAADPLTDPKKSKKLQSQ